jgi:glycerophosphoryl diester phosphodiesterase
VNRPADIDALVALGIDGIFTDFPERLLRFSAARPVGG